MSKFEVNEIVVVMDGSKYYESKILKVECFSKVWKYFVHYQGWKRKWDCWVDDGLVFKKDLAGIEKLKQSKDSSKKKLSATDLSNTSASECSSSRGKKRSQEESLESKRHKKQLLQSDMFDEEDNIKSVLKLQIPLTLKKHMVDEWKIVTKAPFRILSLPRSFTANRVMSEFLLHKKGKVDETMYQKYQELFEGLKAYFDKALPLVLLYRQERDQYEATSAQFCGSSSDLKLAPSDVYGVEHLLRLFVRIPQLSSEAIIGPSDVNFVQQKLLEFLKYIQKNCTKYLNVMDYIDAEKAKESKTVVVADVNAPTINL